MTTEEVKIEQYQHLFNALDDHGEGYVTKKQIINSFHNCGIGKEDARISALIDELDSYSSKQEIEFEEFIKISESNIAILDRCIKNTFAIPNFKKFSDRIKKIYKQVESNKLGELPNYIPQLSRIDPEQFAVSICTVDGQCLNIGATDSEYCIQSISKPINYCIAMHLNGEEHVHKHVGREPSGLKFNEITLNKKNLPHNPMINAGAIVCASMIEPKKTLADRFDNVMEYWKNLSGGTSLGYNNAVYLSEKETADRNFALAHFMREVGAFPEDTNIHETLDFYLQCCSIEANTEKMAIAAATFANAGICPKTNIQVFEREAVKNCLSLMYSCGMYDFSGEFAFSVGLPAKSGVSGALMLVVPNLMGITIWSPRLDEMGNSVRGVEFCKELVKTFNFHNYDSLVGKSEKVDPRKHQVEFNSDMNFALIWASSLGDLDEIRRLISYGIDVNNADYDGRTALHLAAAEGRADAVRFLLARGGNPNLKDRWGNKPIYDAKENGHKEVIEILNDKKKL